ncbi:hypothetical protein C2E23DRAFT_328925 [Lenzites betulinus]|nr:hypothetical protein C2E23DRAFT_328925 [Lenzites betulinus]
MPSILERLRKRTLSHRSSAIAQLTAFSTTSPTTNLDPQLPTSRSEPSLVDRRIIDDLPALLGALEKEAESRGALKPPRPRKRSGLASFTLTRKADNSDPEEHARETSEKENYPSTSRWKGKGRASQLSQQNTGTTSSPWSTFGRHHPRPRDPRNMPYGSQTSSRRGSRVAPSAFYASSSSNAGGGNNASNLTSGSLSLEHVQGTQSTDSRASVAMISSESFPHTFGRHSPSDARARSSSQDCGAPSLAQVTASMDDVPATMTPEGVPSAIPVHPRGVPPPSASVDSNLGGHERAFLRSHVAFPSEASMNQGSAAAGLDEHHALQPPPETMQDGEWEVSEEARMARARARGDGRLLPSASAEPHGQHASGEGTFEPCSPSHLIPPFHRFTHRPHC